MGARLHAEEVSDEEGPITRRSGVELSEYAREVEAVLARGGTLEDVQALRETLRPSVPAMRCERADETDDIDLDAVLHLAGSAVDLEWFRLDEETALIVGAIDGKSSVRDALERTGTSLADGLARVRKLIEVGLIAIR